MAEQETIQEPARDIPVFRTCDVLVVGGGPAGSAAAASAVHMGADTVLVERYGHLGGMSTGDFVSGSILEKICLMVFE
jgi:NADPH-dependent 2,4-dienoyl-CoA reductase/sulfur reductase-like enzyme